jgi:hypothetical protein
MNALNLSDLPAEDRFLLSCARVAMDSSEEQALCQLMHRLTSGAPDWDGLMTRVVRHGIPTLVYHHLHRLDLRADVPAHVWKTLDRAYQAARLSAMRQRFESGRLLKALHAVGVETIPLKGLALRENVYPDPALRPSGDVDLLVPVDACERAEQVLQDLGYVPEETNRLRAWYNPRNIHHLVPYRLPEREVQVEIHWGLVSPQADLHVDVQGLWQRSEAGEIAGHAVRLLSPEDLVAHVALHAAAIHRFLTGLRHLTDVAETVRYYRERLDWDRLAARADQWGARRHVYLALRVAGGLLGEGVFSDLPATLQPAAFDESLVEIAQRRVLALAPPEIPAIVSDNLVRFLLAKSVREKLRLLLGPILFPPRELMAQLYGLPQGSRWVFACYPIHPFRLLRDHVGVLLRLTRGKKDTVAAAESGKQGAALDKWLGL